MSGGQQKPPPPPSGHNIQPQPAAPSGVANDPNWSQAGAAQQGYQHGTPVFYAVDPTQAGPADGNAVYTGQQYYQYPVQPVYNYYTTEGNPTVYSTPRQGDYEETYQMQQTYAQQPPTVSAAPPTASFDAAGASSVYTPLPSGTTTGGSRRNNGKSSGTLFDSTSASYTADWVTQTTQLINEMHEVPDGSDPNSTNYSPNAWAETSQMQLSPTGEPGGVIIEGLTQQLGGLAVSPYGSQSVYSAAAYGQQGQNISPGYQASSVSFVQPQMQRYSIDGNQHQQQSWNVDQHAGRRSYGGNSGIQQNQNNRNFSQRPFSNSNPNQNQGNNFLQFNQQNRQNTFVATGANAVPPRYPNNRGQQRHSGTWRPGNVRNAPSPTPHYSPPNQQIIDTSSSNTTSGPRTPRQRTTAGGSIHWSPPSANGNNGTGVMNAPITPQQYQQQQQQQPRPQQQQQHYAQRGPNPRQNYRQQLLMPEFNPTVPPPLIPTPRQQQQMPPFFSPPRPAMPPMGPYNQMQMPLMSYRGPPPQQGPQQLRSFVPNQYPPYGGPSPYFQYNNGPGPYGQQYNGPPMGPPFGQPFNNPGPRPYRYQYYNSNVNRGGRRSNGNNRNQNQQNRNTPKPESKPVVTPKLESAATTNADIDPPATNTESSSLTGDAQPLDAAMAESVNRGAEFDRDETATPEPVGDAEVGAEVKADATPATQEANNTTDDDFVTDKQPNNEEATPVATAASVLSSN